MNLITLDFESFFSETYTLKRGKHQHTTEEYIRSPLFEPHGAGIRWHEYPDARLKQSIWYDRRMLPDILNQIDWSNTACMCWHAHFDGFILNHHYGIRPAFWIDPMCMARALLGPHISVSLDNVRKLFNLPHKYTPYHLFRGKHWDEIPHYDQKLIAEGCCDEVNSIHRIFEILQPQFPVEEYRLIDMTIRMFTEPVFDADVEMLGKIWMQEERKKRDFLDNLQLPDVQRGKKTLTSAQIIGSTKLFAQLLEEEGVELEYKPGKVKKDGTPGRPVPCLAKTDSFMQRLLEDDSPRVSVLAAARLGIKSTLNPSRAQRLGEMANRGAMCVYLGYCAALTKRWGGGDKTNWQNWPRVEDVNELYLRQSIYIKKKFIAKADAAQIECRILNYCAGQDDIIQAFREGRDLYAEQATDFYGYHVTKETFPIERQAGKVLELLCGFGGGGEKIRFVLRNGKPPIIITPQRGIEARDSYRRRHPMVQASWRYGDRLLPAVSGAATQQVHGRWPLTISDRCVWLPNGLPLIYTTLEWHTDEEGDSYWRLRDSRNEGYWKKIYGAKFIENWVQALNRCHVGQVACKVLEAGYRILMNEHDSLTVEADDKVIELLDTEMSRSPDWLPGVPFKCEIKISERLG